MEVNQLIEIIYYALKDNTSDRFKIIDREHIVDNVSGLKFHLYDEEPFKITYKDEVIADMHDFSKEQQGMMQKLKNLLMSIYSYDRRSDLVRLFQNSVTDKSDNGYTGKL